MGIHPITMMLQAQKHIKKGSDHLQTKTHKFFNTYDTTGPTGTKWTLGSSFNPHQCCASFSPDIPPSDIRPHPVHINNSYINSLIDLGASFSLIKRALAERLVKVGLAKWSTPKYTYKIATQTSNRLQEPS